MSRRYRSLASPFLLVGAMLALAGAAPAQNKNNLQPALPDSYQQGYAAAPYLVDQKTGELIAYSVDSRTGMAYVAPQNVRRDTIIERPAMPLEELPGSPGGQVQETPLRSERPVIRRLTR